MPIVSILVTLVVVGLVMYLITTYVPMAAPIRTVLTVVVVLILCIWLLSAFGVMDYTVPMVRHR